MGPASIFAHAGKSLLMIVSVGNICGVCACNNCDCFMFPELLLFVFVKYIVPCFELHTNELFHN